MYTSATHETHACFICLKHLYSHKYSLTLNTENCVRNKQIKSRQWPLTLHANYCRTLAQPSTQAQDKNQDMN